MKIRRPDDMHVHFRQGDDLKHYVQDTAASFARALVMPNTLPPVTTVDQVLSYQQQIQTHSPGFTPLSTFKLLDSTNPDQIPELKKSGVIAGKLYPRGATTNAEDGVSDITGLYPVFDVMQQQEMVLCLHGEEPGAFVLDRERLFLANLTRLASDFPNLNIVLEHVSTAAGVQTVQSLSSRVSATITIHHLLLTLDDLAGGHLNPHLFCKPIVKTPEDRLALSNAALSGDPSFFFGSDSAPHHRDKKECAAGCAGVYSSPVALPLLAAFFSDAGRSDLLEKFTSVFGAAFYGLEQNKGEVELQKEKWVVPEQYHGIVPLMAGCELEWKVTGQSL